MMVMKSLCVLTHAYTTHTRTVASYSLMMEGWKRRCLLMNNHLHDGLF